jgi:hypothetical protein
MPKPKLPKVETNPAPKTQTLRPDLFVDRSTFFAPRVTIHGPLPEDHPFYALVGRVASEWAHLEHILDTTIWDLLGIVPPAVFGTPD